jgi:hypothetical protein
MGEGEKAPAQTAADRATEHSTIFQRLVKDDGDLVGLAAYGLYKHDKREWLARFVERHGRRPDRRDLDDYQDRFSDADIKRYRKQAEEKMLSFAEVIVEDRRSDFEQEIRARELDGLRARLETFIDRRTSAWVAIGTNLVAWVVTVLLAIAVFFFSNKDLLLAAAAKAIGAK